VAPATGEDHISKKRVVYTLPQMKDVILRSDLEYARGASAPLTMDLYYPPGAVTGTPAPAVLFVTGYRDAGAQKMLGCRFKEMGAYMSWAELAAASGIIGVTYANEEPVTDAQSVLQHLRRNGTASGIDVNRIAVWSCSGNVPNALSLLMSEPGGVKCGVLCYGYMLDTDTDTTVADVAGQFGFVNPIAGRSIDALPGHLPLFIVRAGRDEMPGLNGTIDRFVRHALERNFPITLVNVPDAPHAFDLFQDNESSRETIAQVLQFMRTQLA
jgi:acetyl esterase/lipase